MGHSLINSHRLCGWMVLAQRRRILLIDLSKFIYMLSKGLQIFHHIVRLRHPVWFITLDPMKASVVRQASRACGEYHVSSVWIGGLLTNFLLISGTSWLRYTYFSSLVHSAKQRLRKDIYEDWMLTRFSWPRAVFLCGVRRSYRAAKEALRAIIPCVGIADTATSAHALSLAVPGNDESLEAIYFYNTLMANNVLLKKFSLVFSWATGVRKTSRLDSFSRWFAFYGKERSNQGLKKRTLKGLAPLPWDRYSLYASSLPFFSTTSSLMSKLMRYAMAVPRSLAKPSGQIYVDQAYGGFPLNAKEVRTFFLENEKLFNILLVFRFLASRRTLLKRWVKPYFYALRRRKIIGYSPRKVTFTFRHNYLDLLAPLGFDRDYVYKRAVEIPPFFAYRNKSVEFLSFRILSALFLLTSLSQRFSLESPDAALNPRSYTWDSPYRRRLKRTWHRAPLFFRNGIYFFLSKLLGLDAFASKTHKTIWPVPAATPKLSPKARFISRFKKGRERVGYAGFRLQGSISSRSPLLRSSLLRRCYFSLQRQFLEQDQESSKRVFFFRKHYQVNPKAFTSFNLDTWRFDGRFLPRIYWQFRLVHLASRTMLPIPRETKQYSRKFIQARLNSYPLMKYSLHWLRKLVR